MNQSKPQTVYYNGPRPPAVQMYRRQGELVDFDAVEDGILLDDFLTACAEEFHHPVLNSYLHELCDLSAVIEYYKTPVESPDALYRLSERVGDDLPANLCIQTEPIRFNPNDTSFLKRTAFPGSSNIVSGLATSKRYKGFRAPAARRIGIGHEDRV
ncbi:hypothetical protein T265_13035, partial [Opisthorchis viverrini]